MNSKICSQACVGRVDTRTDLRPEFRAYSLETRALLQDHMLVVGFRYGITSKCIRSIPFVCNYSEAAPAEPKHQCSGAAQRKKKEQNCHDCLLGSPVHIIEGSS